MRRLNYELERALACVCLLAGTASVHGAPVMFITQTPDGVDFGTVTAVFANHRAETTRAPRGGDLWIQYDNGTQRNLTQEAGYANDIVVRDPCIHWDGDKALFSMAVGGTVQNDLTPVFFQIYEVSGILQGETVTITKQPQEDFWNNVSPIYASDDSIIFTSDRPRNGDIRLYPQLDEYESTPTNTGIWIMDADGTDLRILDHSPSGDFSPIVDSFGRIVFTRWDHLQRDQQAGADMIRIINNQPLIWDAVQYESEDSDTFRTIEPGDETFPELRFLHGAGQTPDPTWDSDYESGDNQLRFNQFIPWMMNQDGTELETLNHVGRHELHNYFNSSRFGLPEHITSFPALRDAFLQLREDPNNPGRYYGSNTPEFATHASGQIVYLDGSPSDNPDDMGVTYITSTATQVALNEGDTPTSDNIGLFRDPMPMSDGSLWAAHSTSPFPDRRTATDPGAPSPFPLSSRYDYRIRKLEDRGDGVFEPTDYLTTGISESITYFDNGPYRDVAYNGLLWELQPVEVVSRTRPVAIPIESDLPLIETTIVHDELGVESGMEDLRNWLVDNDLALVVSRDVTIRADEQQEFRLKVFESSHETTDGLEPSSEVAWMQFFEGQQIRGYGFRQGRRVLAAPMEEGRYPVEAGAPDGAVKIGADGSMASFVPAGRALSWQMTEADGDPLVRERYWVTFQPGEMRACVNCHGLNNKDVFDNDGPTNDPQALIDLLQWWKSTQTTSIKDWQMYSDQP